MHHVEDISMKEQPKFLYNWTGSYSKEHFEGHFEVLNTVHISRVYLIFNFQTGMCDAQTEGKIF